MGNILTKFLNLEEQIAFKAYLNYSFYHHNYECNRSERISLDKVIINHNFCKDFEDGISLKTYIIKELNLINLMIKNNGLVSKGDFKKYGDYYFPTFFSPGV